MTDAAGSAPSGLQAAIAAHQAGRLVEAETLYREVLARAPGHPDALHLLGLLAHHLSHNDAALELMGQALRVAPNHAPAHSNLGNVLLAVGRTGAALASFDQAIALQPDFAEAHNNRGNALRSLGRTAEAITSFRQALRLRPDFAEAHNNLGYALADQGETDAALASLQAALALRPDFPEALNNRGMLLEATGVPDAALADLDRALALRPGYVEALNNRGNAFKGLGRLDDAAASYQRALDGRPGYAEAHTNLGQVQEAQGRVDLALASFDRALALAPDLPAAHWNKAIALLLTGDYAAGWPLYEWRWQALGPRYTRQTFAQPLWLGKPALAGRTLLLHHEQGLGDTLQMLRYVPQLAGGGARVLLQVPTALARIAATVSGVAQVFTEDEALPHFDLHCPLMSLPLACQTTLASIQNEVPYLAVAEAVRSTWGEALGARRGLRIGLAWSGASGHRNDRQRSLALPMLLPLLDLPVEFHSLQREYRDGDSAAIAGTGRLQEHSAQLGDLADTAGLIEQLDLVITVDTAVAHLAGALGRDTWLLLPFAPDYRWLLDRDDSPWYPTMRLFRQPAPGDWATVLARVRATLQEKLGP
ncbi:MAG: tetratricopeptide repeat protein [Gammaproteobacteria bacterium]